MFCPNCGSPVSDGSRFCTNCGAALAAPPSPSTPDREAPPQPVWKPDPADYRLSYPSQEPQQQDTPQACQPQPFRQQDYQQAYQQIYPQHSHPQGNTQPEQPQAWQQSAGVPVTAKKRSPAKGILIGVGCLALAALIGGGIWFLSRCRHQNKVLRAAENTLAELKDYTMALPNLNQIVSNVEALSDSDTIHSEEQLTVQQDVSYGEGMDFSYGYTFQLRTDLDRNTGTVLQDGALVSDEMRFPFTIYLDDQQLQAASDAVLEEGEVLSLPLKDLPKQWNASPLAEITDLTLPEDLDLSNLTQFDLKTAMEDFYGEDWSTLCRSFDAVPYEGTSPFEGSGTTYTLTWDGEALRRISEKSGGLDALEALDLDDLDDLAGLNLNELAAKLVGAVLGEAAEAMEAPLFYVEDDLLLALRLTEKAESGEPMEITIRLLGEDNPWEHLTVHVHEDYSSYTTDDYADVTMKQETGRLRIELSTRHEDSDGVEYCYEEGPYAIVYNDADGRITIEDETGQIPEDMPAIYLLPEEGGCRFSMKQATSSDFGDTALELSFSVTDRIGSIAPLSANPTELLKLSEEELEDLAERIEEKLSQIE